jgi:hypothetical protein
MTTKNITYKKDGETYTFYDDKGEPIIRVKNMFGIIELIKLLNATCK